MPVEVVIASHGHGAFCLNLHHENIQFEHQFQLLYIELDLTPLGYGLSWPCQVLITPHHIKIWGDVPVNFIDRKKKEKKRKKQWNS